MGGIPPLTRGDNNAQRRSQRVTLKVSVIVLAHGADKKQVSEKTRTVTVNAHGAMILLSMKVSIGQILYASAFRNRGGSVVSSGLSQPSSTREARSGSRFHEAFPWILAHLVPSARLDSAEP